RAAVALGNRARRPNKAAVALDRTHPTARKWDAGRPNEPRLPSQLAFCAPGPGVAFSSPVSRRLHLQQNYLSESTMHRPIILHRRFLLTCAFTATLVDRKST